MPRYGNDSTPVIRIDNCFSDGLLCPLYRLIGASGKSQQINADYSRVRTAYRLDIRPALVADPTMTIFRSMLMSKQRMILGELHQIAKQTLRFGRGIPIDRAPVLRE